MTSLKSKTDVGNKGFTSDFVWDELMKVEKKDFLATSTRTLIAYLKVVSLPTSFGKVMFHEVPELLWKEVQGFKKREHEATSKVTTTRTRVGDGRGVNVVVGSGKRKPGAEGSRAIGQAASKAKKTEVTPKVVSSVPSPAANKKNSKSKIKDSENQDSSDNISSDSSSSSSTGSKVKVIETKMDKMQKKMDSMQKRIDTIDSMIQNFNVKELALTFKHCQKSCDSLLADQNEHDFVGTMQHVRDRLARAESTLGVLTAQSIHLQTSTKANLKSEVGGRADINPADRKEWKFTKPKDSNKASFHCPYFDSNDCIYKNADTLNNSKQNLWHSYDAWKDGSLKAKSFTCKAKDCCHWSFSPTKSEMMDEYGSEPKLQNFNWNDWNGIIASSLACRIREHLKVMHGMLEIDIIKKYPTLAKERSAKREKADAIELDVTSEE